MQIVLYESLEQRINLYPLSLTRPIADLRIGILTIAEKWSKWLNTPASYFTEKYLQQKYPLSFAESDVLLINGSICPDENICERLLALNTGDCLFDGQTLVAARTDITLLTEQVAKKFSDCKPFYLKTPYTCIRYPEDIFKQNGGELKKDFDLLTKGRISAKCSNTVTVLGDAFFMEEGASAECCTINTLKGPVYLGKNSEIWEGAMIRGAFALGENSQVKLGTKIYSNVSVGPGCRVGGELNTCVIWGNSSKGHEGYLGSSVVGEWCNLGADTNNSNLKNNYKNVRMYHYGTKSYRDTGLQFCGMIMGDHAKCAINTAFNTGTVVGVAASIFGGIIPPSFVADFSWGLGESASIYELDKMFATAELVFARRNCKFDSVEKSILTEVYQNAKH